MRLIDADALYERTAEWEAWALAEVEKHYPLEDREEWLKWTYILNERTAFKHDVADAPTIDAVPVVRCKDCKECEIDDIFHDYWCNGRKVWKDHYCAYGERRTDE